MASPDISKYLDLTVYDLQPSDIYDAAVEYAATSLPEWEPVPGSIEDALLQGTASMTGQLVGAINRLPSGLMEGLLKLYGINRSTGSAPTGTVTVTVTNFNGVTIPAGTRFGYSENSEIDPVLFVFETTENKTIPAESNTINIPIRGLAFQKYPALLAGQSLQLLSALSFIDEITLTSDLSIGADPETDEEFLNRAVQILGRLSEAVALPEQMERYALTDYANIYRAKAYSRVRFDVALESLSRSSNEVTATFSSSASATVETGDVIQLVDADPGFNGVFTVKNASGLNVYWDQNGADSSASSSGYLLCHEAQELFIDEGTGNYIPQNGYVAVYVSAIGGASITYDTLNNLRQDLTNKSIAGLQIFADNAHIAPVLIEVRVIKERAVAASSVQTAIEEVLHNYVMPDHWSWDDAIYKNEIISLVDKVAGVVRVVDVTLSSSDSFLEVDENGNLVFLKFGCLPFSTTQIDIEN